MTVIVHKERPGVEEMWVVLKSGKILTGSGCEFKILEIHFFVHFAENARG